jgi:hypothetical protein
MAYMIGNSVLCCYSFHLVKRQFLIIYSLRKSQCLSYYLRE